MLKFTEGGAAQFRGRAFKGRKVYGKVTATIADGEIAWEEK